jgi:hypothetical protein
MKTKKYTLAIAALLATPAFANASIYDNNATALNINMLTDNFISYAHNGETLSELFAKKRIYGTMTRVDEYGDDGTTLRTSVVDGKDHGLFFKNIWADAKHINGRTNYDKGFSARSRFNVFTFGTTTDSINLKYGNIYFGAFAGYINSDVKHIDSYGDLGGIFAHYDFQNIGTTLMANIGSLNNDNGDTDFNNSWANIAFDIDAKFNVDKTFLIRPSLSIAHTFVSSDDLYVNNNVVKSDNFYFFNITPSLEFIKEIIPDWYMSVSAKYVAHFGGDNDIRVANITHDGTDMDNYTDIGMNIEYNFKQFVFDGQFHKQMGGLEAWSGNINVKYMF